MWMHMNRNPHSPNRDVTEVDPGDYIKVGDRRLPIVTNSAYQSSSLPHSWEIVTGEGTYGMYDIYRYAKAEDMQ